MQTSAVAVVGYEVATFELDNGVGFLGESDLSFVCCSGLTPVCSNYCQDTSLTTRVKLQSEDQPSTTAPQPTNSINDEHSSSPSPPSPQPQAEALIETPTPAPPTSTVSTQPNESTPKVAAETPTAPTKTR